MKILENDFWIYYIGNAECLISHKCGKWMFFFSDMNYAVDICKNAVDNNVVVEAKHSNKSNGVACFYLNIDDLEGHKKVISFFLVNNLIRKTKTGKLYNIPFKLDDQTRAGEYGDEFTSEVKLQNFLNLETGEWLAN